MWTRWPFGRNRRRALQGFEDEIRDHIEAEVELNIARGMSPEEARRQARIAFGNVALVQEDARTGTADGGQVQVGIRDSGHGVPESVRDHIFDAYFTTRDSGNGLGLSVSREFIVNHGGSLELAASETGAHFLIRLPASQGVA